MSSRFARILAVVCLTVVALPVFAEDDNENSTPTAWWIYNGQSANDIKNTINSKNARIIDIKPDNSSGSSFTVTYVQNTGSYGKKWWWYVEIDANTVAQNLKTNNGRLISLKAYDTGGGHLHFAVAMISNTGADAKQWWWYYGKTGNEVANLVKANKARLTTLQSFTTGGQTLYSVIMIAESGADNKAWWWYPDASVQVINTNLKNNNARLLDITASGNGNFNAVMESCSGGCPGWWWYYGVDAAGILSKAQDNAARVLAADSYGNCGSGSCFGIVLISNTPADITACDSQGCISEAQLSANIGAALANKVVGYAYLVGGVRPGYGGQARTNANPPALPMAPDLVTNIASVSKTMTAVAVVQLLSRAGLTVDTKISSYIYSDWKQGTNIGQLTFKHLLTHSSGFGQLANGACGNDITYSALKSVVAGGVTASNIGKPQYGNCNFALLRELMPALQGQSLKNYPDGPQRAKQSSDMYINYVNAHVFQPVGVPVSQCKPPSGSNDILSYPYPAGSTSGDNWGDWSLMCGSGGWVLSANNIFNVIKDLATGNTLLTSTQKKQMFSQSLGWDSAVRNDCPDPNVCKNGDLPNGNISVWTYAGILKCNVPVVVVVNSPLPSSYQNREDIIGLVKDALNNAKVPGTPRPCP